MSAICLVGSTVELSDQKNAHYSAFDKTKRHQWGQEVCKWNIVHSGKQEEVEVDKQKI